MIYGNDLGKQMDGLVKLAEVGIGAVVFLTFAVPLGAALALWWGWNHVTIHIR